MTYGCYVGKNSKESRQMLGINTGHCSWFWDKIFGADISLHCYDHDAAYDAGDFKLKLKADIRLAKGIWQESERSNNLVNSMGLKTTAVGAYILTSTVGIGFWLKTVIENK